MQSMAVIGAYGLSFLTILFGAALADFTKPHAFRLPAAMILLFLLHLGGWCGAADISSAGDSARCATSYRSTQRAAAGKRTITL